MCTDLECGTYLVLKGASPDAFAPLSCTRWVTRLNHKTFDISVKYTVVIIARRA